MTLCVAFFLCATGCDKMSEKSQDLQEARNAYSDRDYLSAELYYKQYLQKNREHPHRWEAWDRLVEIALVRGNNHEAAELLQNMALEFSENKERKKNALDRLAAVYENERHWAHALQILTELLLIPGLSLEERARFNLRLGRAYEVKYENDLALAAFQECSEQSDDTETTALCLLAQGSLFLTVDKLEDAKKCFDKLINIPEIQEQYVVLSEFSMADYLESKGKLEEALVLFRKVMPRYPNPAAIAARVESLENQLEKQ